VYVESRHALILLVAPKSTRIIFALLAQAIVSLARLQWKAARSLLLLIRLDNQHL
jgi:hypothetical protein